MSRRERKIEEGMTMYVKKMNSELQAMFQNCLTIIYWVWILSVRWRVVRTLRPGTYPPCWCSPRHRAIIWSTDKKKKHFIPLSIKKMIIISNVRWVVSESCMPRWERKIEEGMAKYVKKMNSELQAMFQNCLTIIYWVWILSVRWRVVRTLRPGTYPPCWCSPRHRAIIWSTDKKKKHFIPLSIKKMIIISNVRWVVSESCMPRWERKIEEGMAKYVKKMNSELQAMFLSCLTITHFILPIRFLIAFWWVWLSHIETCV